MVFAHKGGTGPTDAVAIRADEPWTSEGSTEAATQAWVKGVMQEARRASKENTGFSQAAGSRRPSKERVESSSMLERRGKPALQIQTAGLEARPMTKNPDKGVVPLEEEEEEVNTAV